MQGACKKPPSFASQGALLRHFCFNIWIPASQSSWPSPPRPCERLLRRRRARCLGAHSHSHSHLHSHSHSHSHSHTHSHSHLHSHSHSHLHSHSHSHSHLHSHSHMHMRVETALRTRRCYSCLKSFIIMPGSSQYRAGRRQRCVECKAKFKARKMNPKVYKIKRN